MARKTIEVADVVARGNHIIATSKTNNGPACEREAVAALVESVLFATDNYAGFKYLPSELDPNGSCIPDGDGSARVYFLRG